MKLLYKRLLSIIMAGVCASGMTMTSLAEEGFYKQVYGPGVNNLSSRDYHSRYQWGL